VLPYKVLELHRQYGSVVRIAPDELAFVDASAWHDIYGLGPDRKQNELDMMTFTPHEPGMEESFAGATFDVHARLRRIYAPAFSSTAIERVSGIFEKYANLLVSRLTTVMTENASNSKAPPSAIVDIHDWYNFVSFDILGDFAFGESFHCLEEARAHFFMKNVVPGIVAAAKMNQLERYGIYSALKPLIPASAMQAKIEIDNYVRELVDKRLEQIDATRLDAFSFLERSELSRSALHQNAIIIVMAGSHTVTTTLTAATWFLCIHLEKLKRAQDEVRRHFTAATDICAKSVQQQPYLDAVIRETLRLVPGGAFGNPRWIRRKGGQMIAGHYVPRNVGIRYSVGLYSLSILIDSRPAVLYTTTQPIATTRILLDRMTSFQSAGCQMKPLQSARMTIIKDTSHSTWAHERVLGRCEYHLSVNFQV
jgi:cytochrome P450